MNNEKRFFVRWKGVTQGPFGQEEVLRLLGQGHICLFHEIFEDGGQSYPLRRWLAIGQSNGFGVHPADYSQRERLHRGYLYCGLSFICPPLLGFALANAQELSDQEKRRQQVKMAWGLTLLGTLAWILFAAMW